MKQTLLQMTQSILSSLNSDEVNSIGDTAEALQVANCLQTTYYNMLGRYDLPENNQLVQLTASGSDDQPVLMTKATGAQRVEWIKYFNTNPADGDQFDDQYGAYSQHGVNTDLQNNSNGWSATSTSSVTIGLGSQTFTVASGLNIQPASSAFVYTNPITTNSMSGTVTSYSGTTLVLNITEINGSGTFTNWNLSQSNISNFGPGYQEVKILPVEEFLRMVNCFNPTEDDVDSMLLTIKSNATGADSSYTFYYKNDKQPQYCCILQNYYIVFDAFDNTQDSTLQTSKTMCMAWVAPTFTLEDSFIPELDAHHFPLLLNDAKSLAFEEIKNQSHKKAELEVDRQLTSLQKWKALADHPTYFEQLPNFGRHSGRRVFR